MLNSEIFQQIRDSLPASVLEVLEGFEDIGTADWAEKYRYVVKSDKSGKWHHKNNPPLKGLMDLMDYAQKTFVMSKGVQTGGTEAIYNYIFRKIDTSTHNALLVMEKEGKVKSLMKDRILKNIEASPKLARRLSDNPDDTTQFSIHFNHGFMLQAGWGTSRSTVSSDAVETVVIDELDKIEDAINLEDAKDRITTFNRTGRVIMVSTPGFSDGPIIQELERTEVIYDFFAVCPNCNKKQKMVFENITWPQKDNPPTEKTARYRLANIVERDRLARYICQYCQSEWDDFARDKSVEHGEWKPRHEIQKRPVSIGVVFPSWLSPFKSLSKISARWIRAQGDSEKIRAFYNQEAAEPYTEATGGEVIPEDAIYQRRYQYWPDSAKWRVPLKAVLLTCAVDVQTSPPRLECEIVAWGEGYESWGIEYRVIPGDPAGAEIWQTLDEYLSREWVHESGLKMKISACGIDTGGHYTRQVYRYAQKRRRVFALKGSNMRGKPIITASSVRTTLKNKVQLWIVGTDTAKDTLFDWMQREHHGAGYMHYHTGYDYSYFRMLTNEVGVIEYDKGGRPHRAYKKKSSDARTEALDLRVYSLAVLEILNVDFEKLKNSLQAIACKNEDNVEKTYTAPRRRVISRGIE